MDMYKRKRKIEDISREATIYRTMFITVLVTVTITISVRFVLGIDLLVELQNTISMTFPELNPAYSFGNNGTSGGLTSTATPMAPTPTGDEEIIPIMVLMPDGQTTTTMQVRPILGDVGRLEEINLKEDEPIPLWRPDTWRWGQLPESFDGTWDGYQLPSGANEACPEWLNRYNTVSMKFDVSGTVLVFGEKAGDYPARFLVPLSGQGQMPVLDNLYRGDMPNGAGPLNASIQVFLAEPTAEGYITVYDSNDFKGNSCTITIHQST